MKKLVSAYKLKMILTFIGLWIFSLSGQGQVWTLQACLDTAQVHNKNLQIQRNNIAIGSQKQLEAKSKLLPKLNVNADYKYFIDLPYQFMPMSLFGGPEGKFKEVQFGVPHNINANLQLAIPLYNPQIKGVIQATEIGMELNELLLKKSEEQIFYEISNLYYNAQIVHHQIQFVDSNRVNAEKLLRNMQLLKQQLMATGTDVNKVVLQIDQLNTKKEVLKSMHEQVMQALKFAMGVTADKTIKIEREIRYEVIPSYGNKPNIDLQIAQTQNRMLKNDLSIIKKSALPTVSLFGTYGTTGFGYDKKPGNFLKFHPVSFVGVQFTYALFDGNSQQIKRNQKRLELRNNELQQSLLNEQNAMQVVNADNQKRVTQRSVESGRKQIAQAQLIYDQTILQQKNGFANLNDVLMADNGLREAQQSYLAVVVEYLKAELELKRLTGNLTGTK
jgi:OMF family outer membrane factor